MASNLISLIVFTCSLFHAVLSASIKPPNYEQISVIDSNLIQPNDEHPVRIFEDDPQEDQESKPILNDPIIVDAVDEVPTLPLPDELTVPECLSPNATYTNWHDATCRSYVVCRDSVSTLEICPEGQLYDVIDGGCVTRTIFSCDITNQALRVASDAISLFRESIEINKDRRVKRSTVDKNNDNSLEENEITEIVFASDLCDFISGNIEYLETNMMQLLKANTDCPKDSICKMPQLSFRCKDPEGTDYDDEDDDDDNDNDDDGDDNDNNNDGDDDDDNDDHIHDDHEEEDHEQHVVDNSDSVPNDKK